MNLTNATLGEVAATVSETLRGHGMRPIVVGGSAVSAHVPAVYMSFDIDLAMVGGVNQRRIASALREIGFDLEGRSYVNSTTPFPIDIVADTPWVDQRVITEYATIVTAHGTFETLHLEDALADRVAAFLYWSDSSSLDVAERAVKAAQEILPWSRLHAAISQLESGPGDIGRRYELAMARLKALYYHEKETQS